MIESDDYKFYWTELRYISWSEYFAMIEWCHINLLTNQWRNSKILTDNNPFNDISSFGFVNEDLLNWFKMVWG